MLAVAEHLPKQQLFFFGSRRGIERQLIPPIIRYQPILAGKFRRYWSWRHLSDPIIILAAFWQSLYLLLKLRPQVVVSAGSFVSVPVVWAAWCCGIPTIVHQPDVTVGLAVRLMAPFASRLTKALVDTHLRGADWIGNPVRNLTPTTQQLIIDASYPTVFIFGGSTGAQGLNTLVTTAICAEANVIHVTGKNKLPKTISPHPRYQQFELLAEPMKEALHQADVIVCRAGIGTLAELGALAKAAIIIPLPHSHQEKNAALLIKHQAAIVLDQTKLTPEQLTRLIQDVLHDASRRSQLGQAIQQLFPPAAANTLADYIVQLTQ